MSNQQNTQPRQATQGQGYIPSTLECAAAAAGQSFLEMLFSAVGDDPADAIINRYGKDVEKYFVSEPSRTLYSVMVNLSEANKSIDAVTLTEALMDAQKLGAVGGQSYINELQTQIVNSLTREQRIRVADEKLQIMQAYWIKREMRKFIGTANNLVNRDDMNNPESLMQYLSTGFDRYYQACAPAVEEDPFIEWIENAEKQKNGECITPHVSCGFETLDKYLDGGFEPRKFYIIGGRPAMGKSVLGGNIALAAAKQEKRVIYFSLEMSHKDLVCRLLAEESSIEHEKVKNILLADKEEQTRLVATARNMPSSNLTIIDKSCMTIDDITSYVRKVKATKGVDLVVIDHLHLIAFKKNSENRTNEIRQIAGGLLALAKSTEVPVVALAQLNRETTATMTKMPNLSNLKDGGALEENADAVMMIHRPYYYYDPMSEKDPPPEDLAIIAVQKNRSGMTGNIEMRFEPKFSRFVEAPTNETIFQQWLQPSMKNDKDPELDIPNGFDLFESVANNY